MFLFFAYSAMLVGFKYGDQVFGDPEMYPVAVGGRIYVQSVDDDSHQIIIDRRRWHDNNFGG